jgi:hypothetical protein
MHYTSKLSLSDKGETKFTSMCSHIVLSIHCSPSYPISFNRVLLLDDHYPKDYLIFLLSLLVSYYIWHNLMCIIYLIISLVFFSRISFKTYSLMNNLAFSFFESSSHWVHESKVWKESNLCLFVLPSKYYTISK